MTDSKRQAAPAPGVRLILARALATALTGLAVLVSTHPAAAGRSVGAKSPKPAFTLVTVGETVNAYAIPAEMLDRLREPRGPETPSGRPAHSDTLELPKPVIRHILPVSAVAVVPGPGPESFLVATRRGVLFFDLSASRTPKTFLESADVAALQGAADGTYYALLRTWTSDVQATQTVPAPILSFRIDSSAPPDTIAKAHPGSANLCLAHGDSVLWVPRLFGRTLDRFIRAGGRWDQGEVVLPQGPLQPRLDKLWVLRVIVNPGVGDPYLFEQARGTRPRLLALDRSGGPRELHMWDHGFQGLGLAVARKGDMVLVNALSNMSSIEISGDKETYVQLADACSAVALSEDGIWVLRAEVPLAQERTRIELTPFWGGKVAIAWLDGAVDAVRFLP
jgi:hypothetical protein